MPSILFKKIKDWWLSHGAAIVAALALTTMIEAPTIIFPYVAGDSYRGINIPTLGGSNVHEYLMRGKEVLDGHYLGSVALREGKSNANYYFTIGEYILVMPIRWLGLADKVNIVTLYSTYNFAGVFFIILLIYFLVLRMSGNRLLAIASALFVVGGYSIVYNKHLFYDDFNIYGRAMFPYVASVFFFVYLNFLHGAIVAGLRNREIFAGVFLGLLFYIYFFAWTFAFAATTLLFGIYLCKKEWTAVKRLAIILGIGLFIGAYNVYRIFSFVRSTDGKAFSYFSWLVHARTPVFSLIGSLSLLLFLVFIYRKRNDKHWPFILALIAAGWVSLNQQIITGKILQYGHYYWFFIVPISIIMACYMVWRLFEIRAVRVCIFTVAILLVFVNTVGGQYRSFFTVVREKLYEQRFAPIIAALNQDKNPGVIFAADEVNETLFAIYTPHDLFWYNFALLDRTPMTRAREALLLYLYINRESRFDVALYLKKILGDAEHTSFYKDLYQAIEGSMSGLDYDDYISRAVDDVVIRAHREKLIADLAAGYHALTSDAENIKDLFARYGVNYVVWDEAKNPEWDLSVIPRLQEVASSETIHLYRMM